MATVSEKDIHKKDDGTVSVGVVLDKNSAQSLVEFKNYLRRMGAFLSASVKSFQNSFSKLDGILKTTVTDKSFTDLKVSDITADINETKDVTASASGSIEKSNDRVVKSNREVADSFKLVDYAAVSVFRKVLRYSVGIYKSLTSAGSNMIETNTRFNRILGDLATQAEAYATAISNAYAITRTEAKTAITKVYQLANASGLGAKNALEMARGVTILGSELASVWDTSTEQAVNALISALQGLPKAAKGYSLYLNTEQIKNTLEEAGYAVKGTLTQQEKLFGTFLKMLKDAGYAIGDFASTETSMANQMKLLNASITTIKESLGSMLNTVMSPILQVINKMAKILIFIVNGLNDLPEPIRFIIGGVMALTLGLTVLSVVIILASRVMQIWNKQIVKVTLALQRKFNVTASNVLLIKNTYLPAIKSLAFSFLMLAVFVGSLVKLIENLNDAQKKNTDGLEDQGNAAKETAKALASYDDVNTLTFDNQSKSIDFSNWKEIEDFYYTMTGQNKDMSDSIEELTGKYNGLYIAMMLVSAGSAVFSLMNNWQNISKLCTVIITKLFSLGKVMASLSKLEFAAFSLSLSVVIAGVVGLFQILNKDWEDEGHKIVAAIGAITAAIGGLIAALGFLKHNYAMAGIGLGIAATGGVTSLVNIAVDDYEANNKTKLATGGIVTGPTRALVGEGKYSEAVIPLGASSEFASMKNDIASAVVAGLASAGGSTTGNINITINVDEDYIYKAYNRQKALRGGV